MEIPQTSYGTDLSLPRAGTLSDLSNFKDVISGLAAEMLPFGVVAVEDLANPGQFLLPTSAADLLKNPAVVMSTMAIESRRDTDPPSYAEGDMANLLKTGRIFVQPEDTVTDGGTCYIRGIANGAGKLQLGAFRSDADGGNAFILAGAKFRGTGSGITIVEFAKNGV